MLGVPVHHCSVKRRARAIEKLYRSYAADATCLIDLVRSSITFPDVDALAKCLNIILEDARVVVLNVKNRLDPGYDSAESAGYRNVSLSLLLVDNTTMGLHVDCHISEVQLGLKDFDDKKSDDGHKRYVDYRDARAE